MKSYDTPEHVTGRSRFVDDLPEPADLLHAAPVSSTVARGRIVSIDTSAAMAVPGAVAVFTVDDVPGENELGSIIQDEPLFADGEVFFRGQTVAVAVAETPDASREMAARVSVSYEEIPAVFSPREAAADGSFIASPRTIATGDVDEAFARCHTVLEGRASCGAQEHLYLETQVSVVIPKERGGLRIFSSTQSPTAVQREVAKNLDLPMSRVEVEAARLGGAFGGKEDQATPWAALAAVAAIKLARPVKLLLERGDDLRNTGKRHPYDFDYKIGLLEDGRVLAYEATFFQNSGAFADLSTAVMDRSLLHATNAYMIPNVKVTGLTCRTNLPPFTAFRGFGGPQGIYCIEAAIDHGARALGLSRAQVQRTNLLKSGDLFPFGMEAERAEAERTFDEAAGEFGLAALQEEVERFNGSHRFAKRGVSIIPTCFGISFTNPFLNQAGALVHVYTDGSVAINTGAVEMGQGVNTKLITVASRILGVPRDRCIVCPTDTAKVINTSPTAASTGADLNGMAVKLACDDLRARLIRAGAKELDVSADDLSIRDGALVDGDGMTLMSWDALVAAAYMRRTNLSAQAHYATPGLSNDRSSGRFKPFAYHVYGAAVTTVTVDTLRGELKVDQVDIIHDVGHSLDDTIDLGQVEGALVQGIGWMTMEEVVYDNGRLATDTLSTYKVPDLDSTPDIQVRFLESEGNPAAVMRSKAVGEPPFLYGIGAFFAARDALGAAGALPKTCDAPLTNERILTALTNRRDL